MLNYLWLAMVVGAVLLAGWTGRLESVTSHALEMARVAVLEVALPLVGLMALWLGMMRLAERAGLMRALASALRPVLRRLFPDVPADHPAMGAMVLNLAANMLGLGNAATPLGLRAMRELDRLNPFPGTATNAMCTFLALNTGSVQLVPVTAMAVLAAQQAREPTAIVGTALLATLCSAVTAVTSAKLLERLRWFRLPAVAPAAPGAEAGPQTAAPEVDPAEPAVPQPGPLTWWGRSLVWGLLLFFLVLWGIRVWSGGDETGMGTSGAAGWGVRALQGLSQLAVPFLLAWFPLYAALRRVRVYEEFVTGAREGFEVGVRIIPYLVAMLVAIGMFRAAGGIEWLSRGLGPLLSLVGFPVELLPLALVRPLSGSGALGVLTELVRTHGPDSLWARMGATMYGSTETTFYVLAVYFGAVGVHRVRHAVWAGLITDVVAMLVSVWLCRWVFG